MSLCLNVSCQVHAIYIVNLSQIRYLTYVLPSLPLIVLMNVVSLSVFTVWKTQKATHIFLIAGNKSFYILTRVILQKKFKLFISFSIKQISVAFKCMWKRTSSPKFTISTFTFSFFNLLANFTS